MDTPPEKRKLSFRDIIKKNGAPSPNDSSANPEEASAEAHKTYPIPDMHPANAAAPVSDVNFFRNNTTLYNNMHGSADGIMHKQPPAAHPPIAPITDMPSPRQRDDDDVSDFDIMKYVGIVLRRRRIIIYALILATLLGITSYLRSAKTYTAHARLLFSPDYQTIIADDQQASRSEASRFNTHLELLRSQTVLSNAAKLAAPTLSTAAMSANLKISRGGTGATDKNDIIDILYTSASPQSACDITNAICYVYIDYIKNVNVQNIDILITKLDTQIAKVSKVLDKKEDMLRVFKENNRGLELTQETNTTISRLSQLETDFQATELAIIDGKQKLEGFKKQIDQQQADVISSISYQNPYQAKLSELELELSSLASSYSAEHYKVRMVTDEINKIKAAMKSDITREATSKTMVSNPIRQELLQEMINTTIEQAALLAKRTAQQQLLKDLDNTLGQLPSVELQYAQLTRETESSLQVLKLLKTRYEEAKIKRDSQDSDLKILELAQPATIVVSGNKASKILITIFIGLCLGIGLAFLFEYLDQSIKEPQEVERKLELPLLGMAPFVDTVKSIIENEQDAKKPIWEPFRALRATLKHIAATRKAKTFIVASALKSEGKSTVTSNIAITMALDGKKVILVDADLRRPQLHSIFDLPKNNGLADYLSGSADVQDILKVTNYPNLKLISAGEHPQNPAELVGSYRFERLVNELKSQADFVIFDSPALLPVSDILSMAPKFDICFMVVRAMWTPAKAAIQAKNQLLRMGCSVAGVVLNVAQSPGYYYGNTVYSKYAYENESYTPSFWREFGLSFEAKLKLFILTTIHAIPRQLTTLRKTFRRLLRKKLFWLLILTALLLLLANGFMRHFSLFGKHQASPVLIENVTAPPASAQQPKSLEALSAIPSSPDSSVKTDAPEANRFLLHSYLEQWQKAFNNHDVRQFLALYDSDSYSSAEGSFSSLKDTIKTLFNETNHAGILLVDIVATRPLSATMYSVTMQVHTISSKGITIVPLEMTWQNSGNKWYIIRESQRIM